jgi:signal transduction histidine kinase
MLHEFINVYRDEIISRCIAKVATRMVPAPTPAEIEHGVPLFLDQLVTALALGESSSAEIVATAVLHGKDLLAQGFTVSQVVHDYGDVCQSITELAVEMNAPISADDFRMLNGCLDVAIAGAVTEYGHQRAEDQAGIQDILTRVNDERLGYLVHELRDLVHTMMLAFDVVKSGTVGVGGSTSKIIDRALLRARDLVSRSIADVRLASGEDGAEEFAITGFIDELAESGLLEARARGITLCLRRDAGDAVVKADRQVLATAMMNILQNALKFTRADTTVVLGVRTSGDRVIIEIQDECGGLSQTNVAELFRPFQQRGTDRTGLGLGLPFSKKVVEAIGGRLSVQNRPRLGCVFTVDLPRIADASVAV